jgi:hypothetical protein
MFVTKIGCKSLTELETKNLRRPLVKSGSYDVTWNISAKYVSYQVFDDKTEDDVCLV